MKEIIPNTEREFPFPWQSMSKGHVAGAPVRNKDVTVVGWPKDLIMFSKSDSIPVKDRKII
jgi:hypothetical protein